MVLQNSITTMRNLSLRPELRVALAEAMFVCPFAPLFPLFSLSLGAPLTSFLIHRPNVVMLLHNADPIVQEHAAGTLSNLSIESRNDNAILLAGALPSLVLLLNSILQPGAVSHLFPHFKIAIVEHAASILHNLAVLPDNHKRMVQAEAVPAIISLLLLPIKFAIGPKVQLMACATLVHVSNHALHPALPALCPISSLCLPAERQVGPKRAHCL